MTHVQPQYFMQLKFFKFKTITADGCCWPTYAKWKKLFPIEKTYLLANEIVCLKQSPKHFMRLFSSTLLIIHTMITDFLWQDEWIKCRVNVLEWNERKRRICKNNDERRRSSRALLWTLLWHSFTSFASKSLNDFHIHGNRCYFTLQ